MLFPLLSSAAGCAWVRWGPRAPGSPWRGTSCPAAPPPPSGPPSTAPEAGRRTPGSAGCCSCRRRTSCCRPPGGRRERGRRAHVRNDHKDYPTCTRPVELRRRWPCRCARRSRCLRGRCRPCPAWCRRASSSGPWPWSPEGRLCRWSQQAGRKENAVVKNVLLVKQEMTSYRRGYKNRSIVLRNASVLD